MGLLSVLGLGFVLGLRHATDADHVVTVSTIVSRYRSLTAAAWIGTLWGAGHTLTNLAVGAAVILFGIRLAPQLSTYAELTAACLLVVLGIYNLFDLKNWLSHDRQQYRPHDGHRHTHNHGDYVHSHAHRHRLANHRHRHAPTPLARADRYFGGLSPYQLARPLIIGVVHGLAGSAAVTLLVLAGIHETGAALAYLLLFGIGTVVGMLAITLALAAPFAYGGDRVDGLQRVFRIGFGAASVVLGVYLITHMGMGETLFHGSTPAS